MNPSSSQILSLVEQLQQLRTNNNKNNNNKQIWLSISGPPGSGKSSLAEVLTIVLPNAVMIPMDGFHYYKSHLSNMPDPDLAFARRGADWTFDSEKFINVLKSTHEEKEGLFPSFDHAVGDPVENDIKVTSSHDFVIVEGLYLLLSTSPWNEVKDIVDLSIYVDADIEILKSRLIGRHMMCFKMTEEEARARAENNDIPNAVDIIDNKHRADIIFENN